LYFFSLDTSPRVGYISCGSVNFPHICTYFVYISCIDICTTFPVAEYRSCGRTYYCNFLYLVFPVVGCVNISQFELT
jgi:hypothetical protein